MNSHNSNQLELINLEEGIIIVFIISLIVSLLLVYNTKLKRTNQQTILSDEEALYVAVANAIVVVIATIGELFIIVENTEETLAKNGTAKDLEISSIELFIGVVAVILAFLQLYVVMNGDDEFIFTNIFQ